MDFKILQQSVSSVVNAIQNSAIASVRTLTAHTFPARVTNFPKTQDVKGTIVVGNQKNVEKQLQKSEKTRMSILEAIRSFRFPKSFEVSNFPSPAKPLPFPRSFEVSNFPKVEYPKEIKISNQPTEELVNLHTVMGKIEKAVKSLKLDPTINVEAPKADRVVVPAPNVTVTQKDIDYEKLSKAIASEIPDIDYKKLAETLSREIAGMVVTGGGGGGGGKYAFQDTQGTRGYGLMNILRQLSVVQEERWGLNNSETIGDTTYTGEQDTDGNWIVRKIVKTDLSVAMTYATKKNNTETTYTDAWTNRALLDYDLYAVAFAL